MAGTLFFFLPPGSSGSASTEADALSSSAQSLSGTDLFWRTLEPGLELGLSVLRKASASQSGAAFVVLRIDPTIHNFALCMASDSGKALPLAGWSEREGLRAGINAGMYLPDKITNIGYMRNGDSINNNKLGGRLGAFFVSGPRALDLPLADIVDKDGPAWRERLDQYAVVVQNYRLMNSSGRLLWPEGGDAHSIAAIAKDKNGRILYILCQEPLTVQVFSSYLKSFSLDTTTVMYVEGGRQAGLFVRMDYEKEIKNPGSVEALPGALVQLVSGGIVQIWRGQQSLLRLPGTAAGSLPNILGVRLR